VDHNRFTVSIRSVSGVPSRRDLLRGLAGAGLGLGATRLPHVAAAKKKRRSKKQKARPNAFGCLSVGVACKNADQCCSGICEGKNGKRSCRAHDTGGCKPGVRDTTCAASGTDMPCTTSAGAREGRCNTTTGNAGYCAVTRDCFECRTDMECQEFCGPGAACIPCADCPDTGGTSCATADGTCVPPPRPL
jgi:hypothetical protein